MKKIIVTIVAALMLTSIMALAGCQKNSYVIKEGYLTVATNAEFKPFEYKEGSDFLGVDIDLAKEIAKELNLTLSIKDMDFDAVVSNVKSGKADIAMAGLTVNEVRKKSINFSDEYFNASQYLIIKKSDTRFDGLTTAKQVEDKINSLSNQTIGAQNGTTGYYYAKGDEDWEFDGFTQNGTTTNGYPNGSLAVKAIIDNNIDMVIIDELPARSLVTANSDNVKLIDIALTDEQYAIGVRKNNADLLNDINEALKKIKADGRFEAILAKYFINLDA